jgi:hypothetical protein
MASCDQIVSPQNINHNDHESRFPSIKNSYFEGIRQH